MQNGHINGAGNGAQQTVQVNPQQAAAFALQFLPRAPHTQAEREAFDYATMFLQAIANGQVIASPAQAPTPHTPTPHPPTPHPPAPTPAPPAPAPIPPAPTPAPDPS
jgi:hypothetical protein